MGNIHVIPRAKIKTKKKILFRKISKSIKRFLANNLGLWDKPGSGNLCSCHIKVNSGEPETVKPEEFPDMNNP